jgi:hypothetical protein
MREPEIINIPNIDPKHPNKVPDGTTAAFCRIMEQRAKRALQFTTLFPPSGVSHSNPTIVQEA